MTQALLQTDIQVQLSITIMYSLLVVKISQLRKHNWPMHSITATASVYKLQLTL